MERNCENPVRAEVTSFGVLLCWNGPRLSFFGRKRGQLFKNLLREGPMIAIMVQQDCLDLNINAASLSYNPPHGP